MGYKAERETDFEPNDLAIVQNFQQVVTAKNHDTSRWWRIDSKEVA